MGVRNAYGDCKQHKIAILRIPYIYGIDHQLKLISIFDNFIETGIVPDEIIEWYSQFNFSNYANIACSMNIRPDM